MADIDNSGPKQPGESGVGAITEKLQDKRTKDGRRNAKEDTLQDVKAILDDEKAQRLTSAEDTHFIKNFAKQQSDALQTLVRINEQVYGNFDDDLQFQQAERESLLLDSVVDIRNALIGVEANTKDGGAMAKVMEDAKKSGGGAMFSKLGIILAGVGVAAAGIGFGLNQAAQALKSFEDVDGMKIAKNINDIMTIVPSDEGAGEMLKFLGEGATFFLVMTGLGVGLAAFGIGAGVASVTSFLDPVFGEKIKYNVLTLLSIPDEAGGKLDTMAKGGALLLALTGLGVGLAIFGAGSTVGVTADVIGNFMNADWAGSIKRNVLTLLSIADYKGDLDMLKSDSGGVTMALTNLGVGLAVFGIGSTIAGIGEGVTNFTNPDWAQSIKDNVMILLSIGDAAGGNVEMLKDGGAFFLAMTGLGLGLAVFGLGQTFVGIGNFFSGDNMAQRVKDDVQTLISVVDQDPDILRKSRGFKAAMTNVADAMAVYGSGTLKKAGADFLGGIAKLFTFGGGEPSPVDVAIRIGNNEAKINKGAAGMRTLARSLETFSRVDLDSADLSNYDELMEDLIAFTTQLAVLQGTGTFGGMVIEKPMLDTLNEFSDTLNHMADALNNVTDASNNFALPDVNLGPMLYGGGEANRVAEQTVIVQNVRNSTSNASSTTVIQTDLENSLAESATNSN
tara:strand:+ start:73 stop:2097 length:2025 start_codon:yes stop_codon:yes gene_type:complete